MLSDSLILVLAFVLMTIGIQTFLNPDRRKVASESIKPTLLVVAGFFFFYYWYTGVSSNKSGGYSNLNL
jgi:hypothetical protein